MERPATVKDFAQMLKRPKKETDIIQCEYCGNESELKHWVLIEDAVDCDACGEHDGLKCPVCEEIHDYIFPRINLITV